MAQERVLEPICLWLAALGVGTAYDTPTPGMAPGVVPAIVSGIAAGVTLGITWAATTGAV